MEEKDAEVGLTKKHPGQLPTAGDLSAKKRKASEPLFFSAEEDDESVEELMGLLEGPEVVPFKVRFVPYPYTWQQSISPPSSAYITINVGNEESCGSSFSDSDCSLMASVDLGGLNIAGFIGGGDGEKRCGDGGACGGGAREARGRTVKDGCGGSSWDWDDLDEALATFLGE